jgi:hypothetical protein
VRRTYRYAATTKVKRNAADGLFYEAIIVKMAQILLKLHGLFKFINEFETADDSYIKDKCLIKANLSKGRDAKLLAYVSNMRDMVAGLPGE